MSLDFTLLQEEKKISLSGSTTKRRGDAKGKGSGADTLIWMPNADGKFSTKSAWEVIRVKMPRILWADWVWHSSILKFMAITMWKGLNNALSVDDRIRKVGIQVVSKCNCCKNGEYENQSHVLAEGEFARNIWKMCAHQVGMTVRDGWTCREVVANWYNRAKKSTTMGKLMGLLPSIITWRLWIRRCKARMEGIEESVEQVWMSIKFWVTKIGEKLKTGNVFSGRDEVILKGWNIPSTLGKHKTMKLVRWCRPNVGRYKLNSDGSSRGNPGAAGAGGLIRDSNGKMVTAYAISIDQGTSSFAEFMGVFHGLKIAKELGLNNLDLELDSITIVNWLRKSVCGLWYVENYWEELQEMMNGMILNISHVYREGNGPADMLARMASEGYNSKWTSFAELPWKLRGLLKTDKLGFPHIWYS